MSAKTSTKICILVVWVAAVGVGGRSTVADHLPTHGGEIHLDSGPVIVGSSPMLFTAYGADDLTSPNGYHWEIHVTNVGGFGVEEFTMAIEVETPTGPITLGVGTASTPPTPPSPGLYWDYHLNPDPFGEIAPLAVRMTYSKPRIGLVPLAFHTTITEEPLPIEPPCQDRVPPPPWWVPRAIGEGGGSGEAEADVVFTLIMPSPGDSNGDGSVDAADYVDWRKTDGTKEGYDAWRTTFGEGVGAGGGFAMDSSSSTVPEPAGALLLMFGAVLCNSQRRWFGR